MAQEQGRGRPVGESVSEVWVDRVRSRAPEIGEWVERGRGDRSDQKTKAGSGGGLAEAREGPLVGSPRCERIRLMVAGWVIMAIIRRRPPQEQTSASTSNTRLRSSAQGRREEDRRDERSYWPSEPEGGGRLATGLGGLTPDRAGFAPAGRRTGFHEVIAFFNPP